MPTKKAKYDPLENVRYKLIKVINKRKVFNLSVTKYFLKLSELDILLIQIIAYKAQSIPITLGPPPWNPPSLPDESGLVLPELLKTHPTIVHGS